jgi:hypothetical protein
MCLAQMWPLGGLPKPLRSCKGYKRISNRIDRLYAGILAPSLMAAGGTGARRTGALTNAAISPLRHNIIGNKTGCNFIHDPLAGALSQ